MARIALIDDDATEAMILEGMLEHGRAGHELVHATTLEAFSHLSGTVDLVLLDRRLPPYDNFAEGLAALARTSWRGPVVLVTAFTDDDAPAAPEGFSVFGPVDKADLLTPEAAEAVIARALG